MKNREKKNKENNQEESTGSLGGKGILGGAPKQNLNGSEGDTSEGMSKILPKVKLITFEGKESKAWVRKYIKYFEVYGFLVIKEWRWLVYFWWIGQMHGIITGLGVMGNILGKILKGICVQDLVKRVLRM